MPANLLLWLAGSGNHPWKLEHGQDEVRQFHGLQRTSSLFLCPPYCITGKKRIQIYFQVENTTFKYTNKLINK